MARDLLRPPAAVRECPDPAVEALPLFRRLRDALMAAARFRDQCRRREASGRRWGEPAVFFFNPRLQAAVEASGPARAAPDPYAPLVARQDPQAAAAWHTLPDLLDEADRKLSMPEVRNAARAVPGLVAAVVDLSRDHPRVAELAALLAVPDDEVFLVLNPAAGMGWRVRVRGIADVGQFHVLLANAVADAKPDPTTVAAYRNAARWGGEEVPVARGQFQLYRPQALRSDGTLPDGLAGCDHWLWPDRPLAAVPAVDGERVILIGEPVYPAEWDAESQFPNVLATLEVVEAVNEAAVDAWLREWCGAAPQRLAERPLRRAA